MTPDPIVAAVMALVVGQRGVPTPTGVTSY